MLSQIRLRAGGPRLIFNASWTSNIRVYPLTRVNRSLSCVVRAQKTETKKESETSNNGSKDITETGGKAGHRCYACTVNVIVASAAINRFTPT